MTAATIGVLIPADPFSTGQDLMGIQDQQLKGLIDQDDWFTRCVVEQPPRLYDFSLADFLNQFVQVNVVSLSFTPQPSLVGVGVQPNSVSLALGPQGTAVGVGVLSNAVTLVISPQAVTISTTAGGTVVPVNAVTLTLSPQAILVGTGTTPAVVSLTLSPQTVSIIRDVFQAAGLVSLSFAAQGATVVIETIVSVAAVTLLLQAMQTVWNNVVRKGNRPDWPIPGQDPFV